MASCSECGDAPCPTVSAGAPLQVILNKVEAWTPVTCFNEFEYRTPAEIAAYFGFSPEVIDSDVRYSKHWEEVPIYPQLECPTQCVLKDDPPQSFHDGSPVTWEWSGKVDSRYPKDYILTVKAKQTTITEECHGKLIFANVAESGEASAVVHVRPCTTPCDCTGVYVGGTTYELPDVNPASFSIKVYGAFQEHFCPNDGVYLTTLIQADFAVLRPAWKLLREEIGACGADTGVLSVTTTAGIQPGINILWTSWTYTPATTLTIPVQICPGQPDKQAVFQVLQLRNKISTLYANVYFVCMNSENVLEEIPAVNNPYAYVFYEDTTIVGRRCCYRCPDGPDCRGPELWP